MHRLGAAPATADLPATDRTPGDAPTRVGAVPIEFPPGSNYLEPGIHAATVEEVHHALVAAFPQSTTRLEIFEQWQELTEEIRELVKVESQWLDGSFVSRKLDPNDLDLTTTYSAVEGDSLDEAGRHALSRLLSGPNNEKFTRIDSWPTPVYPVDHPAYKWLAADREYFRTGMFARDDRTPTAIEKGFVEVTYA
jgi:hypothetical protein